MSGSPCPRARRSGSASSRWSAWPARSGTTSPATPRPSGALLAEAQSLRLMTHRSTLRSLAGADPGPGASLRKLLGAEHEQRVQELGLVMLGPEGAVAEGRAGRGGPRVRWSPDA